MGIRDEEIKRLIHYAKGLGVKVIIYNKINKDNDAEWTTDGSLIQLYCNSKTSKIDTILSLVHELGHHTWFIHEKDRQPDLKFDEAIVRQNLFETDDVKNPVPKHLRKKILAVEIAGTGWWESIYKDTNLKIPKWKLHAAMEFDIWMYEIYCESGHFPKGVVKKNKHKEIQNKWRKS